MSHVYLHGFTGQGQGPLAPTLPGHAGRPPVASLWEAADVLAADLPPSFDLVGYSLGARIALHLALAHPQRVSRLVLIGAATHAPASRIEEDEIWARQIETDYEQFKQDWDARPIFAGRPPRIWPDHDPVGLARALRAFSPGRQDDLRPRLQELQMPTLWLAGEHDAKFVQIAHESAPACRRGQALTVPGCGHDVPLERPEALGRLLAEFLTPAALAAQEAP